MSAPYMISLFAIFMPKITEVSGNLKKL